MRIFGRGTVLSGGADLIKALGRATGGAQLSTHFRPPTNRVVTSRIAAQWNTDTRATDTELPELGYSDRV